jgi:hypothetical protein
MTAKLIDIKNCPDWPRWLSREQSAVYVGVSVNSFMEEVEKGIWPRPEKRGGRLTWDRKMLDVASDQLSGLKQDIEESKEAMVAKAEAAALSLFEA